MSAPVSLARMQQLTTGLWLLGLMGWVAWWTGRGQLAVAGVGALVWLSGHAFWLGITFLMAWAVGRGSLQLRLAAVRPTLCRRACAWKFPRYPIG